MITVLHLLLVVPAAACFFLAALEITVRRLNLIAAGLCLWLVSTLIK